MKYEYRIEEDVRDSRHSFWVQKRFKGIMGKLIGWSYLDTPGGRWMMSDTLDGAKKKIEDYISDGEPAYKFVSEYVPRKFVGFHKYP